MANIIYRGSKSSRLTIAEMNSNFTNLNSYKIEKTIDNVVQIPAGPTITSGVSNAFRFNSTTDSYQIYTNGVWSTIATQGATGYTGSGYQGSKGYTGSIGTSYQGSQGYTGSSTGAQGYTGSQGTDNIVVGDPGYRGSRGDTGATGPKGNTGARGSLGATGANGTLTNTTYLAAKSYTDITIPSLVYRVEPDGNQVTVENNTLYLYTLPTSGSSYTNPIDATYPDVPLVLVRTAAGNVITLNRSGSIALNMYLSSNNLSISPSSGHTVDYNDTMSDYRLKENLQQVTSGSLTKINKLIPYYYTKTNSDNNTTRIGLLAHELQEVFPNSVIGEKDAVDELGKPKYQVVNYLSLIPHIALSLQELSTKIKEFKSTINNT